ncbi:hypothetical protein [Nocardia brasiliensis]|uniref:hypothetical protein n=1 Tax=Nocardia brasiliensis TaxID=37326 RepID=UPI002457B70D|nr:hypothetical protein [Nocardia brasiliensis]
MRDRLLQWFGRYVFRRRRTPSAAERSSLCYCRPTARCRTTDKAVARTDDLALALHLGDQRLRQLIGAAAGLSGSSVDLLIDAAQRLSDFEQRLH